jgi:hypothetical protein
MRRTRARFGAGTRSSLCVTRSVDARYPDQGKKNASASSF